MDAIETLMNEHRIIERGIDALLSFVDEIQRREGDGSGGEREELARFVTFIREFADTCHHGKEEEILFAAMVESGFPRQAGPIGVMLMEHDEGRARVRELDALAREARWTGADRDRLHSAAHGYGALLRQHIQKEDAVLYPMAEQHLSAETLARVSAACERFEAEKIGSGVHERLHTLAEDLVARHAPGVGREAGPGVHAHGPR